MPTLITADLHLSDNPRDAYRHQFIPRLIRLIKKYEVDTLLILGDLTEEKDRHSAWLVNAVVDHMYALAQVARVVILRGNHDYVRADTPFYAFLRHIENITWINNPTTVGPDLYLPHTTDYDKDWEDVSLDKRRYIFAHNTFQGADVDYGRRLDGIALSTFPPDAHVISGDIHIPQQLGCVTYVGAPYTVDFGDDYEPRVLLLDRNGMKTIKLHGPQKVLIEISDMKLLDTVTLNPGDVLKVRVRIAPEDYASWAAMRREIEAWGETEGYTVYSVHPIVVKGREPKPKAKVVVRDDAEVLRAYAAQRGIDKNTLAVGLELLEQA